MKQQTEILADLYQLQPTHTPQRQLTELQPEPIRSLTLAGRAVFVFQRLLTALLWCEPFWLLALTPSLLLRDYLWDAWLHPWLVVALWLFWPLRLLYRRAFAPPTPLTRPALLLLCWSPVGLLASSNLERSWEMLGYLSLGLAWYFALLNWSLLQRWPGLLVGLITAAGLLLALIGPAVLTTIPTEFLEFSSEITQSKPQELLGTAETVNPNVLAGVLMLPLPLLLGVLVRTEGVRNRWLRASVRIFSLLSGALMFMTVILTQSRGAYWALALGLATVLILRWPWFSVAMGVALLALSTVFSLEGLGLFFEDLGGSGSLTSLSGRWEVWVRAIYAITIHPLTGIGLGTFDLIIPQLYPYETVGHDRDLPHAHNLFLQVGVDLGIPGLLCYGWLLFAAGKVLLTLVRQTTQHLQERTEDAGTAQDPNGRLAPYHHRQAALQWALAAGNLGVLVSMIAHGIFDAVIWGTKLAVVAWFFIALTALLHHRQQMLDGVRG